MIQTIFQQPTQPDIFFVLNYKTLKSHDIRGYNLLSIIEECFPKNNKGDIHISFNNQISLPNAPYALLLKMFLETAMQTGYKHLIIEFND